MAGKLHWLIERGVVGDDKIAAMTGQLDAEGVAYDVFRVIPFTHDIAQPEPRLSGTETVICYGSTSAQEACKARGWLPASWTGPEIDETAVQAALGPRYLNSDAFAMPLRDLAPDLLPDPAFIKPNGDSKLFSGHLTTRAEFARWRERMLEATDIFVPAEGALPPRCSRTSPPGYLQTRESAEDNADLSSVLKYPRRRQADGQEAGPGDTVVIVATPKVFGCEWRFFVVDGKVASACCYRQYGEVMPERWVPEAASDFVADCIAAYDPLPAYALDITQIADGSFRVLEINTMNNSGFYACEPGRIVQAINDMLRRRRVV